MAEYQDVFRRVERKYLLSAAQYDALLPRLLTRMTPDAYGRYTIGNIYYDTEDFAIIRASLDKPIYKEKLRLRAYGTPGPGDDVYVELKKKFRGVVYKRRVQMPLHQAQRFLRTGEGRAGNPQIQSEIDWYRRRMNVEPRVMIAYEREALACPEDAALRVTFDTDIRMRMDALTLAAGTAGVPVLDSGRVLMEIKLPGVCPLWLCHALDEHGVFPCSYSKYGEAYTRLILPGQIHKGDERIA